MEGTARLLSTVIRLLPFLLPEERPVGGYCKLFSKFLIFFTPFMLPEERPVGGYCKFRKEIRDDRQNRQLPEERPVGGYCKLTTSILSCILGCCQRRDPLEGTASPVMYGGSEIRE